MQPSMTPLAPTAKQISLNKKTKLLMTCLNSELPPFFVGFPVICVPLASSTKKKTQMSVAMLSFPSFPIQG